jgi:hypothetical protein
MLDKPVARFFLLHKSCQPLLVNFTTFWLNARLVRFLLVKLFGTANTNENDSHSRRFCILARNLLNENGSQMRIVAI